MNETLWAVLIAGGIGILGGTLGTWITTKGEEKKQMLQLGFRLGLEEWKAQFENSKIIAARTNAKITMPPPFWYAHFNTLIFEKLAHGNLSLKAVTEIARQRDEISEAIDKIQVIKKHN